jgi:hypothetical protein
MRKISGLFGVLILSMGLMSCGGGGGYSSVSPPPPPPPPPPPTCTTGTFCMGGSTFYTANATQQPVALSVAANAPVTWTNDSSVDHNVTFDDPATALGVGTGAGGTFNAPIGSSNQRKFATSGSSHPFHCTIHAGMSGVVNVQ